MAVTHLGTNNNSTNGVAVTLTLPAFSTGDLGVIGMVTNGAPLTAPSGYTLIRSTTITGTGLQLNTYYRILQAGDANPTVNGAAMAAILSAFSGTNTSTPLDVENGQTQATTTAGTAPSVTTTQANDLMVHFTAAQSSPTQTPPTSYTEPANGDLLGGGSSTHLGVAYLIGQAAGATGTISSTLSAANNNAAHIAAFKEAGGAASPEQITSYWVG